MPGFLLLGPSVRASEPGRTRKERESAKRRKREPNHPRGTPKNAKNENGAGGGRTKRSPSRPPSGPVGIPVVFLCVLRGPHGFRPLALSPGRVRFHSARQGAAVRVVNGAG